MGPIKIAIVGVGNCASSLVQGIEYYRGKSPEDAIGLMHWEIGGYRPQDTRQSSRSQDRPLLAAPASTASQWPRR